MVAGVELVASHECHTIQCKEGGSAQEELPMTLPDLPQFLTQHADEDIRITGHRIGLEHVVELYRDDYSPQEIHEEFPTLPLQLINQVIDYYHANRGAVDAYVDACHTEIERQRAANPSQTNWEELKRRFEEMQRGKNS
jgi:uncharacterized protein (DUF433 family)